MCSSMETLSQLSGVPLVVSQVENIIRTFPQNGVLHGGELAVGIGKD